MAGFDDTARVRARRGRGSAARARRDRAGGVPLAADPDRHRLSARRRHRHPGTADGAEDGGAARPAGGRREPSGRERLDRHPGRRAIRAGRSHHPVRHHRQPRGQSGALRRPSRHEHGARLRAAVAGRLARLRAGGEPVGAGEVARGADRAGEGEPGRDAVRVERQWRPAASVRRAAEPAGRHPHPARALSRQRAGLHRPDQRPGAVRVRCAGDRAAAYREPASCARSRPPGRSGWRRCPTCRSRRRRCRTSRW